MAKRKSIEPTTQNDLGAFLVDIDKAPKKTRVVKEKVISEPKVIDTSSYNPDYMESLGFEYETLPSGRINLCNKVRFSINDISSSRGRGNWIKTFEEKSIKDVLAKIKTLEFVE